MLTEFFSTQNMGWLDKNWIIVDQSMAECSMSTEHAMYFEGYFVEPYR